jgi:hypothetical protein
LKVKIKSQTYFFIKTALKENLINKIVIFENEELKQEVKDSQARDTVWLIRHNLAQDHIHQHFNALKIANFNL